MKLKIVSSLICLILAVTAKIGAQNTSVADRVQAQKVAYLTNELSLTPDEAEKFWPVYKEFKTKERQLKKGQIPPKALEQMNEAEATAFINNSLDAELKSVELKRTYYKEFRKILPASKVARLDLAERGFKKELIKKISRNRQDK